MKRKKRIIPFIRHVLVEYGNDVDNLLEIFNELGYTIYEDPTMMDGDDAYFISNKPLTYRWLLERAKWYGVNVKWFKETFEDELKNDEPLEEKW